MAKQPPLKQTASQTIGPFFHYALTPESYGRPGIASGVLANADTAGERVRIEGRVFDGEGRPMPDALVEIWQANAAGRYNHPADDRPAHGRPADGSEEAALDPGFRGFGRLGTDADGAFSFETVKPGPVPGRGNTLQAPHINVILCARGMLDHAFTRIYFSDEAEANGNDPVLSAVEAGRRATLVAERRESDGEIVYRFDIRLQGEAETVFFDA
jgi:protocatechuate 3,4-dioxygenase alpha subunit